jgi:hypothetical protein
MLKAYGSRTRRGNCSKPSIAGDGSAVELRGFLADLGDEMETVLGYTLYS